MSHVFAVYLSTQTPSVPARLTSPLLWHCIGATFPVTYNTKEKEIVSWIYFVSLKWYHDTKTLWIRTMGGTSYCDFTLPRILYSDTCCQPTAAGCLEGREPSVFLVVPARTQSRTSLLLLWALHYQSCCWPNPWNDVIAYGQYIFHIFHRSICQSFLIPVIITLQSSCC